MNHSYFIIYYPKVRRSVCNTYQQGMIFRILFLGNHSLLFLLLLSKENKYMNIALHNVQSHNNLTFSMSCKLTMQSLLPL